MQYDVSKMRHGSIRRRVPSNSLIGTQFSPVNAVLLASSPFACLLQMPNPVRACAVMLKNVVCTDPCDSRFHGDCIRYVFSTRMPMAD